MLTGEASKDAIAIPLVEGRAIEPKAAQHADEGERGIRLRCLA
jgi:hypothetical protein